MNKVRTFEILNVVYLEVTFIWFLLVNFWKSRQDIMTEVENGRFKNRIDTRLNVWRHSLTRWLMMIEYLTCYVIMKSSVNERKSILTYLSIFLTNLCLFYMKSLVAIKTHSFQTSCNCVNKAIISYILCLFCCRWRTKLIKFFVRVGIWFA